MRQYLHYTNTPAKKHSAEQIPHLACAVSLTTATETVRLGYTPHIHTFHKIREGNLGVPSFQHLKVQKHPEAHTRQVMLELNRQTI